MNGPDDGRCSTPVTRRPNSHFKSGLQPNLSNRYRGGNDSLRSRRSFAAWAGNAEIISALLRIVTVLGDRTALVSDEWLDVSPGGIVRLFIALPWSRAKSLGEPNVGGFSPRQRLRARRYCATAAL